jgi:Zn-finger nucleic acid-binding protein
MSERSGIEIDYCPSCRGVWLDRGELDKIIEKSNAAAALPPNYTGPAEVRGHSDDYKYKYKRKKSFLEEIFD